jgi:hypothetical protein
MTGTSAIVSGNTRKAWVDDARGNTTSGKRLKQWVCYEAKARGVSALCSITTNTNKQTENKPQTQS